MGGRVPKTGRLYLLYSSIRAIFSELEQPERA